MEGGQTEMGKEYHGVPKSAPEMDTELGMYGNVCIFQEVLPVTFTGSVTFPSDHTGGNSVMERK